MGTEWVQQQNHYFTQEVATSSIHDNLKGSIFQS